MNDTSNLPTVSWREYVEMKFTELDKLHKSERASNEQRLEKLNELREEVMRDRSQFLQKAVYDQMHNALVDRVVRLEAFQSRLVGLGTALVVGAGIVGAVIAKVFGK